MAIKPIHPRHRFNVFCDRGIIFSLCAIIFVLPASIAYVDSFAALAVFFYLLKKINGIRINWSSETSSLNFLGKMHFIWKGFAPPAHFLNRPCAFLTLAIFVSVVFSQYPSLSLTAFVGKFLKCLFVYFSFIEAFSSERRIWIFLSVFLFSAFIVSLSGVFQHHSGKDFIKGQPMGTENFLATHRVSSSFSDANGFGVYLLLVIALVSHLLLAATAKYKSWGLAAVWALLSVLLLVCLCWTYSRSSWLGYLVGLLVMVLLDKRKIFFAAASVLVFIFIFMPSLHHVRHMQLVTDENVSVQKISVQSALAQGGSGRFALWKKAISIIRSSPVFGTGLNTYLRVLKRDRSTKTWWYAHNCYLQMTAETGLVGLTCFLGMLFVLFRHGLESCRILKEGWRLSILQGAIGGLSGFLVQSFFDNTFYSVQLGVLMWLVFGLTAAVIRLMPNEC